MADELAEMTEQEIWEQRLAALKAEREGMVDDDNRRIAYYKGQIDLIGEILGAEEEMENLEESDNA